jgi:hypothetical protein
MVISCHTISVGCHNPDLAGLPVLHCIAGNLPPSLAAALGLLGTAVVAGAEAQQVAAVVIFTAQSVWCVPVATSRLPCMFPQAPPSVPGSSSQQQQRPGQGPLPVSETAVHPLDVDPVTNEHTAKMTMARTAALEYYQAGKWVTNRSLLSLQYLPNCACVGFQGGLHAHLADQHSQVEGVQPAPDAMQSIPSNLPTGTVWPKPSSWRP